MRGFSSSTAIFNTHFMTAAPIKISKQLCHLRGITDIGKFLILVPDFITVAQENSLERFVAPKLRRKRYDGDHWDSVISKYKETEMSMTKDDDEVTKIIEDTQNFIKNTVGPSEMVLSPPHVIDLSADGFIGNHPNRTSVKDQNSTCLNYQRKS